MNKKKKVGLCCVTQKNANNQKKKETKEN